MGKRATLPYVSNRSLFLAALSSGFIAALPTWTRAKGQWCNDEHVLYRADLTLVELTVDGGAVAPPTDQAFSVSTKVGDGITARVFCPGCAGSVVSRDLVRQP